MTFNTENVVLTPLETFIKLEQKEMLTSLKSLVRDLKRDIKADPACYRETDDSEPSVDIRLCVDHIGAKPTLAAFPQDLSWELKIGDVSYDTHHSDFCGAACVDLDTIAEDLLVELVDQILEQDPHAVLTLVSMRYKETYP